MNVGLRTVIHCGLWAMDDVMDKSINEQDCIPVGMLSDATR